MGEVQNSTNAKRGGRDRLARAALAGLLLAAPFANALGDNSQPQAQPVALAVFDFELEDISASAAAGENAADAAVMQKVSDKARQVIAQSGRYRLIDTQSADAEPARKHVLHSCGGCEAGIARQLGAEQALLGVITRVEKSSYAVKIQISDARTGKLVNEQSAVFLGGDDGWGGGVSSLIRHRLLAGDYPP